MTTHETIKEIKAQFRLFMNGVVSQSMREKGLDYKLNFGIELPRLKEISLRYEKIIPSQGSYGRKTFANARYLPPYSNPLKLFYQR